MPGSIALGISWALAIVLVFSAIVKLRTPDALREAVSGFGLRRLAKSRLVFFVPAGEILTGVVAAVWWPFTWLVAVIFAIYATVAARAVSRQADDPFPCACLDANEMISPFTAVRAAVLFVLAMAAGIFRPMTLIVLAPVEPLITCAAAVGIVASIYCLSQAHQMNAQAHKYADSIRA